jgi:DNA invertase Pin-like site-specific DNA recombinase
MIVGQYANCIDDCDKDLFIDIINDDEPISDFSSEQIEMVMASIKKLPEYQQDFINDWLAGEEGLCIKYGTHLTMINRLINWIKKDVFNVPNNKPVIKGKIHPAHDPEKRRLRNEMNAEESLRLYKQGLTILQVAKAVKVSIVTVGKWIGQDARDEMKAVRLQLNKQKQLERKYVPPAYVPKPKQKTNEPKPPKVKVISEPKSPRIRRFPNDKPTLTPEQLTHVTTLPNLPSKIEYLVGLGFVRCIHIAEVLKERKENVRYHLKVSNRAKAKVNNKREMIIDMYEAGGTYASISEELGVASNTISKYLTPEMKAKRREELIVRTLNLPMNFPRDTYYSQTEIIKTFKISAGALNKLITAHQIPATNLPINLGTYSVISKYYHKEDIDKLNLQLR